MIKPNGFRYVPALAITIAGMLLIQSSLQAKPYKRVGRERERPPAEKTYKNGVGVELGAGNYNGVSFMRRWDRTAHLQGMIGFRLFQSQLLGTFDYIQTFPRIIPLIEDVTPYFGGGAIGVFFDEFESLLGTEDDQANYFGARVPLGAKMDLNLFDLPFCVYAEITPGLLLLPLGRPFLGITLGARYLF